MYKLTGTKIDITGTFLKPALASIIMGLCAHEVYVLVFGAIGKNSLATLVAMMIAVVAYIAAVFATKCLGPDEILMMPKGAKILKITDKLHLTNK